jgi:hypothetical protein
MNVASLADQIHRELDSPDDVSIASLIFWLRTNLGRLNSRLEISLAIDDGGEFSGDYSIEACDVYKEMYKLNYYTRKTAAHAGAAGYDSSILEMKEGDVTVKKVNRNEIAKVFLSLKRDTEAGLDRLVGTFKLNAAKPIQVAGELPYTEVFNYIGEDRRSRRDFY